MSIIFLYMAIIIAVVNGWQYYAELKRVRASQNYSKSTLDWPSTTGQILTSEIIKEEDWSYDTDGHSSVSYVYVPKIEYIYTIDGVSYDGLIDDISPLYDEDAARNIVRRYSIGSPITIYYDSQHPGDAVLSRSDGTQWNNVEQLEQKSSIIKICIVVIVLIVLYRILF